MYCIRGKYSPDLFLLLLSPWLHAGILKTWLKVLLIWKSINHTNSRWVKLFAREGVENKHGAKMNYLVYSTWVPHITSP